MRKVLIRFLVAMMFFTSCFGIIQKQSDKSERWYQGYGNKDVGFTVTSKNVIGVNITTPSYKLHVEGDFYATTINTPLIIATVASADSVTVTDINAAGTITANAFTDGLATLTGGGLTGLLTLNTTTASITNLGANLDAQDFDITNINNLDGDQVTASVSLYSPLSVLSVATIATADITTASIANIIADLDANGNSMSDIANLDADNITASVSFYTPSAVIPSTTIITLNATYLGSDLDADGNQITNLGTVNSTVITDGLATLTGGGLTGLLTLSTTTASITNLGADLNAQGYQITNIGTVNSTVITDGVGTFTTGILTNMVDADFSGTVTANTGDFTNLKATNLERDLDGTGFDLTIADINASGTITANSFIGDLTGTATTASNVLNENVHMDVLSGATYSDLADWFNSTQSSGKISGGEFTDNGDGTIKVAAGTGIIRASGTTSVEPAMLFDWDEAISLSVTDEDTSYIYIDYNSGTPTVAATLTKTDCDNRSRILLGKVFRKGSSAHLAPAGMVIDEATKRTSTYLTQVFGEVVRASGVVISEVSDRYLASTDGVLFAGLTRVATTGVDTSGSDTFKYYYYDGDLVTPAWVEADVSTINNIQYNDVATGLEDLSANRYGVHWVYGDYDGHIMVVYGQGDYRLNKAVSAQPPSSLPDHVADFGFLAAKIIIKKSATNFNELLSAYDTAFTPSGAADHNELGGLQGGTATEYYHLTATEAGYYTGASAQSVLTTAAPEFTGVSVSGTVTSDEVVATGITATTINSGTIYIEDTSGFYGDMTIANNQLTKLIGFTGAGGVDSNATVTSYSDFLTSSGRDITGGGDITAADNIYGGGVVHTTGALGFRGEGSLITDLYATELTSGTVPDARITGALTGLTNLTMSGLLSVANIDASGTITANSFVGSLTGTADLATTANYATIVALENTVATSNYAVYSDYATLAGTANALSSYDITVSSANYATTANYANDSDKLDAQEGTYYTNASNISSGTLGIAYMDSSVVTSEYNSSVSINADIEIPTANAFMFGDIDGAWRVRVSGNNLVFERKESGTWENKGEMQP